MTDAPLPPPNSTDPALEVTVTAGRTTGTQLLLHQSSATFGRSPDAAVPLDLATASREHGTFERRDGRWFVVNHSPNGLRLGGRKIRKRPAPIREHDEIVIGDQHVMTLRLRHPGQTDDAPDPLAEGAADPVHADKGGRITRTKLLAGIVIFWVLLFGVLLVLRPMFSQPTASNGLTGLPVTPLTDADIQRIIRTPLPDQAVNDLRASEAIREAQNQYALRDLKKDAPYRAMAAYKKALAYSPDTGFADPLAERRYLDLQQQLTADAQRRYRDALGKLKSRRFGDAYRALGDLMQRIPDHELGDASLQRHLQLLRDFARRRAKATKQLR